MQPGEHAMGGVQVGSLDPSDFVATFTPFVSHRINLVPATSSLLHRVTAVLAVAMMLTLTVASDSPVVHDWLHADSSHDTDHQCAVLLFANGVTFTPGTTALAETELAWRALPTTPVEEKFWISPRYLRQPERGPPVS